MFKGKIKKDDPSVTSTIIGNGIQIDGAKVSGNGSLRVDGVIYGDITIQGSIIVGETGLVKGNITVSHALIAGKVDGNVQSSSMVHLTTSASLSGNIISSSLVIDEGAVFSGSCQMRSQSSQSVNLVYAAEPNELSGEN